MSDVINLLWDLIAPVGAALRALAITLFGLILAFGSVGIPWSQRLAIALGIIVLAQLLFLAGRGMLHVHARAGLGLMEAWVIAPVVLAVLASAGVALVTLQLTAPEDADPRTKILLGTLTTAACSFLSVAFIAATTGDSQSRHARRIKDAFHAKFPRTGSTEASAKRVLAVENDSPLDRWSGSETYAGTSGWGFKARWARANAIAGIVGKAAAEKRRQEREAAKKRADKEHARRAAAATPPQGDQK